MKATAEELLGRALQFSSEDREELAEALVASLGVEIDPEVERAHLDEVMRRREQAARGEVAMIPAEEAFRRARASLAK
jgi:hypothetical protein